MKSESASDAPSIEFAPAIDGWDIPMVRRFLEEGVCPVPVCLVPHPY